MANLNLVPEQVKDLLLRNWMTHDSLWYTEVADRWGMTEASPMNLRVCRKLGRIEFGRLLKAANAAPPRNFNQYRALFELGVEVFVPDFINLQIEYPGDDSQIFHVAECFAHKGMVKADLIADYQCGIFERIEGWFDAMGAGYIRTPDLSRCLKYRGEECKVRVRFQSFQARP
jgi:hypothetical protein